ncbi:retrovirus-related pol polyprotein from transposon TNT 1-94 [Tanacetum coccineum]
MSKFSIPIFDVKIDFTVWKMTIEDVLVQQGGDRDMGVVECHYCEDKGHMQVRCPQFREDLKNLRDSKGKKKVDNGLCVLDCCFKKMASDMSKFSILMFDGKMDFTVWKMTIKDVLVQQGIDEALEEKQPIEMKDDVWKTMQKKASSTIRLFLKIDLYSLKLKEGNNLHDHINSFNQLVCQLANVDDAIKDEEQALLMLSSLPKSYKPFVQTMLTGKTTLTFEDVLKALRDNERMTGNDSSSSSDKLLLADDSGRGRNFQRGSSKGRSKSRMGGDRDMSVVECYYCGDKGHMQVRCPQFREDLKSLRDSKGKKKVDGGEMNVVDNGGDEFLMTETPMDGILREEKPKWVLDNAASSHICNDRAMFETLNGKGQFGEIKVGSKQMMKIEGVGSVRFKLHDGSVKTALNVKYVPGAARNILSLGVLTSRGYRYVGRKDTCKVYKRDELVIRGRKIPNNLCYLEGEALQGRTCCGGNKGKKKIEKRVHFSDKDEVSGILSQGKIY